LVAIIYLAVNMAVQVVSTVNAHEAIQQISIQSIKICDSGLSTDGSVGDCIPDQQNVPGDDSKHCYVSHYSAVELVFTDYSPTCDLARIISAEVETSSRHPSLIKKPPRNFS
jgi:hypothetical protein